MCGHVPLWRPLRRPICCEYVWVAHHCPLGVGGLSVRLGLGEMRTLCRCLLRQDSEQGGAALCKVALTRTFARPQPEH
jgi:hypothetical protein